MMLDINGAAMYQAAVPERLLSRFFGAFLTVNYGVRPIGSVAGGLLGEDAGPASGARGSPRVGAPRRAC